MRLHVMGGLERADGGTACRSRVVQLRDGALVDDTGGVAVPLLVPPSWSSARSFA